MATVFLTHRTESRITNEGESAVARIAQSPTSSSTPHELEYRLSAPKTLIGTLTLTISGLSAKSATGSMEIVVEGAGPPVSLRWSAGQRLSKKVFKGVALTSIGLRVKLRGLSSVTQTGKGSCSGYARAAVCFVGPKAKGGE